MGGSRVGLKADDAHTHCVTESSGERRRMRTPRISSESRIDANRGDEGKLSNCRHVGVNAVHLVSFYIKLYNINIKP
jgi:hypothetical protein